MVGGVVVLAMLKSTAYFAYHERIGLVENTEGRLPRFKGPLTTVVVTLIVKRITNGRMGCGESIGIVTARQVQSIM